MQDKNIILKLKLIYLPYLLALLLFCGLYTLLNWLLIIKLEWISLKEVVVDFVGPFLFSGVIVLFYFRPKIKCLKLDTKKGSLIDFYSFIMWMGLVIPTIMSQMYLEKASGGLTPLKSIADINKYEKTKYYTLENLYLEKDNIGFNSTIDISGRHSEYLNMSVYVVIPIYRAAADTAGATNCLGWMGKEYTEQISNELNQAEKEQAYQYLLKRSEEEFQHGNFYEFVYLDKVPNSEDGDGYKGAVRNHIKFSSSASPVFLAVNEPFENRLGDSLEWIFKGMGIGSLVVLIMVLVPRLNTRQMNLSKRGKAKKSKDWNEIIELIRPKKGFFITPILIYLNVGVYLLMIIFGLGFIAFRGIDLLNWGANFKPSTLNGEQWRLLTNIFLHGGIMHLLANMYGLLFVSIFLEPLLGSVKFLLLYLVTGIIASCASIWWYSATVSVGASGAIFGLYGAFLVFLLTKMFDANFAKSFLLSTSVFIGFNLLAGLNGGIDNAAHVGGLVSGFIIGLIIRFTYKAEKRDIAMGKHKMDTDILCL